MIYTELTQLVGNTPLMELKRYAKKYNLQSKILAKLEYFNPAGSVKDRVAANMIADAELSGKLKKGATIIEPTSGNTGIGLAALAVAKGYKVILTMPETMSVERINLIKAYGAKVVLTSGKEGMLGASRKAEELEREIEGSMIMGQFSNPANVEAHYLTTAPEIYSDTKGKVDIFVAGVGTGGTVTGVGKFLKEKNPDIQIVAVEPASSPLITKGVAGPHKIQGIGANFLPSILDLNVVDEVLPVADEAALETAREIGREEGFLVGISSGAALYAARELAEREENIGKTIVVLMPDTGDRYLSTELFNPKN